MVRPAGPIAALATAPVTGSPRATRAARAEGTSTRTARRVMAADMREHLLARELEVIPLARLQRWPSRILAATCRAPRFGAAPSGRRRSLSAHWKFPGGRPSKRPDLGKRLRRD